MNEIEFIQKLDATAGDAPAIEVSNQVIRRIRLARAHAGDSRPMWLAALVSTLAAAAILMITVRAYSGLQDPFGDLLTPITTVFQ